MRWSPRSREAGSHAATRAHPGGGGGTLRCGWCPRRAAPHTGGSRRAPLHGRECLASSRVPATRRAALASAGQGWAGLDRCAPVPSRWEEWATVVPAVCSVCGESWGPRCPDAARLDIGRIRADSDGSPRMPTISTFRRGAAAHARAKRGGIPLPRAVSVHVPPARPSTCPPYSTTRPARNSHEGSALYGRERGEVRRLATRHDRRRDSGATWRDRRRDSGARPAGSFRAPVSTWGRCHAWSERGRRPPSACLPSPRQHHRETPRESQRAARPAFTSAAASTRRTNAPHMEGFPSWESIPPILQPALSTTHRTAHNCTSKE